MLCSNSLCYSNSLPLVDDSIQSASLSYRDSGFVLKYAIKKPTPEQQKLIARIESLSMARNELKQDTESAEHLPEIAEAQKSYLKELFESYQRKLINNPTFLALKNAREQLVFAIEAHQKDEYIDKLEKQFKELRDLFLSENESLISRKRRSSQTESSIETFFTVKRILITTSRNNEYLAAHTLLSFTSPQSK